MDVLRETAVGIPTIFAGAAATAFASAAVAKLRNLAGFERAIGSLAPALPPGPRRATSVAVPILEIAGAYGVVFGPRVPGGILLATLLCLFTGVIGWNLLRGNRVPCNCFGGDEEQPLSGLSVSRNALLGVAIVSAVYLPEASLSPLGAMLSFVVGGLMFFVMALLLTAAEVTMRFRRELGGVN